MSEWLMILVLTLSPALFAIGGTGFKWARRYVLPIFLAIIALLSGLIWWRCLGLAGSLVVALCLPYGERTPLWGKCLTFSTYGLVFLWLGWSWWIPLLPAVCIGLFILSNNRLTEGSFPWKIVEGAMGFGLGATLLATLNMGGWK
jgi:hypothetical protein